MAVKNHSESNSSKTNTDKDSRFSKGDYVVFFFWLFSIFTIVMSARLLALPNDEFPTWLSILITLGTVYIVAISYGATLSTSSTRAIIPNLLTIILVYIVPALLAIVFTNEIVPKTEIVKLEDDAIELQYDGYDVSFWFDADVTYYRPFVPLFPFNTVEAHVGNVYYDNETYDISDCIDTNSGYFYSGETITCPTGDGLDGKIRLDFDKLSYKIK